MQHHRIAIPLITLFIAGVIFGTEIQNFAPDSLIQHGTHHVKSGLPIIKTDLHIQPFSLYIHQFHDRNGG
ncbi:Uncharacterised protein [Klebsiella pneumoniae]|nr:Uncharacterised protein [Klebsiella pneumoniae]